MGSSLVFIIPYSYLANMLLWELELTYRDFLLELVLSREENMHFLAPSDWVSTDLVG